MHTWTKIRISYHFMWMNIFLSFAWTLWFICSCVCGVCFVFLGLIKAQASKPAFALWFVWMLNECHWGCTWRQQLWETSAQRMHIQKNGWVKLQISGTECVSQASESAGGLHYSVSRSVSFCEATEQKTHSIHTPDWSRLSEATGLVPDSSSHILPSPLQQIIIHPSTSCWIYCILAWFSLMISLLRAGVEVKTFFE